MTDDRPFLRVREVAMILGVVPSRVYQLIASGVLPSVRVGGAIRVPRSAWRLWLESQTDAALASLRTAKCPVQDEGGH
jgi:excisionase family DNA binding protein